MKLQATILAALAAAVLPFGTGFGSARAQIADTLNLGNLAPLKDVFMRNLDSPSCTQSALVEVYTVTLYKSVLLTNTVVGASAEAGKGRFSITLPRRPATGTKLRAVAYDAATTTNASFFCSAVSDVPSSGDILFDFSAPKPMARFDGDEEAARADAIAHHLSQGDFDGDGMSDYAEAVARTDIENAFSLLAFESISSTPAEGTLGDADAGSSGGFFDVVLRWQAAADVTYLLQYTPSLLPDEVAWENILDPIRCTADDLERFEKEGTELHLITRRVTIPLEDGFLQGHFRVLVENQL